MHLAENTKTSSQTHKIPLVPFSRPIISILQFIIESRVSGLYMDLLEFPLYPSVYNSHINEVNIQNKGVFQNVKWVNGYTPLCRIIRPKKKKLFEKNMCTAKDRNNFTTFFAFFFGGFVAKITSLGFLPYTKIAQSNFLIVWECYNSDHNNKKGKRHKTRSLLRIPKFSNSSCALAKEINGLNNYRRPLK